MESRAPGGPPPPIDDEATLWPQAAKGDLEAADALARCTYRAVYASLYRLCGGNEDLAADLTQETYRKAWRSIGKFKGGSQFSTWLYRIAYNTFLNHVQRPRPLSALDERQAEDLVDPGPSPGQEALTASTGRQLRDAVMELPDELRLAVTAHYWAELPVREIARLQGITPMGVRKRLVRARRQIERRLKEPKS